MPNNWSQAILIGFASRRSQSTPCSLTFIGDDKEVHKVRRLTNAVSNTSSMEPPKKKIKAIEGNLPVAIEIFDKDDSSAQPFESDEKDLKFKLSSY